MCDKDPYTLDPHARLASYSDELFSWRRFLVWMLCINAFMWYLMYGQYL